MDDAQASLGIPSSDMVPVKYLEEVSVLAVLGQLLPTLLLIGATYWLISRQMNQMGGMGLGGMGGKGKNGQKVRTSHMAAIPHTPYPIQPYGSLSSHCFS
jgi:ATP-dependent Zn protease